MLIIIFSGKDVHVAIIYHGRPVWSRISRLIFRKLSSAIPVLVLQVYKTFEYDFLLVLEKQKIIFGVRSQCEYKTRNSLP
jgi:hypothetical protein